MEAIFKRPKLATKPIMITESLFIEPQPLLESQKIDLYKAIYESAQLAIPFALSRLAITIQNFGNGIVIVNLKISDAIAAAPIMFMIQHCITGAARGALSAVNTVVSDLNGQQKTEKIGAAVNQGLVVATMIGVPTTILFFTSPNWLCYLGIEKHIANQVGKYIRALSYGILPTYWSVVDQNFLLSIKRSLAPIMLNSLFVGTSMAIGYPWALTAKDIACLGYGVSIAALITFIVGRSYLYFNKNQDILDRTHYNLFSFNFDSGTSFRELMGLSIPNTLQALSEWLPTTLITFLSANEEDATNILEAEEPSMQLLTSLNQILLGLATAATVSVSNALGNSRRYASQNQQKLAHAWKENARIIGYSELIVTSGVIFLPTLLLTAYPDPIVNLFSNNKEIFELAKNMLRLTGATLLIDGIRNTTTGALLGRKESADNFFTSLTNLIITSAAATTAGYFLKNILGSLSFFLCRLIGVAITATALLHRWENKSNPNPTVSITGYCFSMWNRQDYQLIQDNPLIEEDTEVANPMQIRQQLAGSTYQR